MTTRKLGYAKSDHLRIEDNVFDWPWPASPTVFNVYDKYADIEVSLVIGDPIWSIPVQGEIKTFEFALETNRLLQQKLISLTQADCSPSSIYKFTRSLLLKWPTYLSILKDGPDYIEDYWDDYVKDIDTAKTAKAIVKVAIASSLGQWRNEHTDLIRGLDTRANASVAAQQGNISRRGKVLDLGPQIELVKILDIRTLDPSLEEWQAEGLMALALAFQHGVRPVQLLSLRTENVHVFSDASGTPVCIVSFHSAKRKNARTDNGELLRQVKPEWAMPITSLLNFAKKAKRTRLFTSSTGSQLWANAQRVCKESGFKVDFKANQLRHTSVQALADAGHSQKNIQLFLGHANKNAAIAYIRASRYQGNLINTALGTSKLYGGILSIAAGNFITVDELRRIDEHEQIGAVVGNRIVAGIGRCKTKQNTCNYDPVMSCYGCHKYIPALDPTAHMEAILGMREQVIVFLEAGGAEKSPAYLQLIKSLAGAQCALDESKRILGEMSG